MSKFIVPLVTPFTDDQSQVSEVRLTRLIRSILPHKPAGFIVCGPLGEYYALSIGERKHVLEIALRESGDVPIWTNVTTETTMSATDLAQHAVQHGARGCVVGPPSLCSPTDEELRSHFRMIAKFGPQTILLVESKAELPGVTFVEGGPEGFSFDGATSVLGALLDLQNPYPMTDAMLAHGPVRTAKGLLQYRDMDAGPPRSPIQTLPVEQVRSFA